MARNPPGLQEPPSVEWAEGTFNQGLEGGEGANQEDPSHAGSLPGRRSSTSAGPRSAHLRRKEWGAQG